MNQPPIDILLSTRGGLHGARVLQRLLASPHVRVVGVIYSSRISSPREAGFLQGVLALLKRSGWRYLMYLWCSTSLAEALLLFSSLAPVQRRAAEARIPVLVTPRINDAASLEFISRLAPDLMLSAFFNQHIGDAAAAIPALGAINIHPSPLPHFKGVDPVFFAALRGGETGVSVHRVSPALDGGNILRMERMAARPGQSVFMTTSRLYDRGAQLLLNALDDIAHRAPGQTQPQPAIGDYDSWPTHAQVSALKPTQLVSARDLFDLMCWRVAPSEANVGKRP